MKWKTLFLLTIALVVTVAGCTSAEPRQLSIVTGGTAGTYYPIGGAIATIINGTVADTEAAAVTSDGSVANARSISSGEAELALIENSIAYYARQGIQMFEGQPIDDIRGIAALYPEIVQIITLTEYGIANLSDLEGKSIGVGAPGSGTAVHILAIMEAIGLDETNVDIQYLDFKESVEALKNGTIHAGCVVAGTPTAAINDIASVRDVAIVSIPDDIQSQLISQYPFYVSVSIAAGTYEGVDVATKTIAVQAMLVTKADVSKDLIYSITKAIFENPGILTAAHERGNDITLETALDGMSIPLHPGALKYYEERELPFLND